MTKLQTDLLRDGYIVQAIRDHGKLLHHFGGRSGDAPYHRAKGMDLDEEVVVGWFGGRQVTLIGTL